MPQYLCSQKAQNECIATGEECPHSVKHDCKSPGQKVCIGVTFGGGQIRKGMPQNRICSCLPTYHPPATFAPKGGEK